MNKKILMVGSIILTSLMMTGCGSNDKPDGNVITNGDAAISILKEGEVKLDNTRGCMKYFLVHAVDGNGNPIPNLSVDANVIVTAKASGVKSGQIETTAPVSFIDNTNDFSVNKVVVGDKLIILPSTERNDPSYLGNWKINKVEGSKVELYGAAYNLETTDRLNYVIGNEEAYVQGYGTAVAHIEKTDSNGTAIEVDDGYAGFYVLYDLALIGHTYAIGVHTGDGYRLGASVVGSLPDCTLTETPPDQNDTNSSI